MQQVEYGGQVINPKALLALYLACKDFVYKCDNGQAESINSYKQMKDAIRIAESIEIVRKND